MEYKNFDKFVKYNLADEVEDKDFAYTFFSKIKLNSTDISPSDKLANLEDRYTEYCIDYFTDFGEFCDTVRKHILRGYDYLKMILMVQEEFDNKDTFMEKFLHTYDSLITAIGSYSFKENKRNPNSFGSFQNAANFMVLELINNFRPFVIRVFNTVKECLENYSTYDKVDGTYSLIYSFFELWVMNFNESLENINWCEKDYRKDLDRATGRDMDFDRSLYTQAELNWSLGDSKKDWRLSKNAACNLLLEFWEELYELYINLVKCKAVSPSEGELYRFMSEFDRCMRSLEKSPVYFCFLDDYQKYELAEMKKVRRERASE